MSDLGGKVYIQSLEADCKKWFNQCDELSIQNRQQATKINHQKKKIDELEKELNRYRHEDKYLDIEAENIDLKAKLERAVEALRFYGDSENYCDEGVVYEDIESFTHDQGYKARKTLEELEKGE